MKILIDAMGGDKAPLEILKGTAMAKKEYRDASLCLVGKSDLIQKISNENNIDLSGIEIVNANDEILMTDPPLSVRNKPESSLRIGLDILAKGEADALVSAGSTGAIHTGATLFIKRTAGIRRAAIGTILPFANPMLLLDSGANTQVTPDHLVQFAIMGSIYMKEIYGLDNPRVGLLNNGSEEIKGTKLQIEAYRKLCEISEGKGISFVGNIEGNDAPAGKCDVLITDGFTGNVFLKLTEGTGKLIMKKLKGIFGKNLKTKLAYLAVKKEMAGFKKEFDAGEQGGAPILGIRKTVIKAHGSSDCRAIKNAIGQAIKFSQNAINSKIEEQCKKFEYLINNSEDDT